VVTLTVLGEDTFHFEGRLNVLRLDPAYRRNRESTFITGGEGTA
jgi:hypothetical protein